MFIESLFKHKSLNRSKLSSFGFREEDGEYVYVMPLADGQFSLHVAIGGEERLKTRLVDAATGEEYVLHLVDSACGAFVGEIRREYEAALTELCEKCYETEVFRSDYAHRLIEYVREKYGDEPEYLWARFPSNAVWRRKDNRKWYGALLTVSRAKLGIEGDEPVEIVDLRIRPDELEGLLDGERYFAGYHMNKKNWFTMRLDGSVPFGEICERLEESYALAKKK